ncbi:MAG: hypothetical protein KC656_21965, partial [Myxococcales bacterium]|nr:hypothetical protein [Myxococcales bacterium]
MSPHTRLSCLAAGLLASVACGTETGNPEQVALAYNARTSAPEVVGLRDAAPLTVDGVWLRLSAVELQACDDGQAAFPALGLADHGGDDAALQTLLLPPGPWCGLHTTFATGEGTEDPPAIQGASVGLLGTLGDRELQVVTTRTIDVELELPAIEAPTTGGWL